MMKKAAEKALWLAKGAALFWGSALTLALMFGVAATAVAAVPGDPFRLGKANSINNAITTLVGTKSGGPMLAVDNNSAVAGSRALDLRVAPGRAPMVVSAGAGKAKNLNADKLDNLEPSQIKGARAYAWVIPDPEGSPSLDPARTSGFTSVEEVAAGRYCLSAPGLSPDNRLAVASVEGSSTFAPKTTASALVGAEGCGDGRFEVSTRRTIIANGLLTDTADDTVGFVVAVM
jgi:hypothetical protein